MYAEFHACHTSGLQVPLVEHRKVHENADIVLPKTETPVIIPDL